jgi:two-component sensor histidine kinase
VHIFWRTDGDALTMSWTERDGPPVCVPEWRGFGTTVIETMANHSLDGAVDLDYAPSGLIGCLTCPAANALERTESRPV